MNCRSNAISLAALRRSLCGIVYASALLMASLTARAASGVTIGGPFTLIGGNGMVVTDQTYRGKWLLVYVGYTLCPDTCPHGSRRNRQRN
jgi:protein SCO1